MSITSDVSVRHAQSADALTVAALHADSWRRHYRGAYSDRYLDGDLDADRLSVWTERLRQPDPEQFTLVAEHETHVVGFAHVVLDDDAIWGTLLENLHIAHSLHRRGIGTRLLAQAAQTVIGRRPGSGIYLWVQEQNQPAQAFYVARSGTPGDRQLVTPPRGDPRNLHGTPVKIRVSWSDPTALIYPS